MLSPETLQSYREMTPSRRLQLTLESMRVNEPYLLLGTEEQVARKFQLLNKQNDERNESMLLQLSKSSKRRLESLDNEKFVQ